MTPFSLAETWRLNNRANLMLLDSLSPDQLNHTPFPRARSIADQFAHLHNVRMMWLEVQMPKAAFTKSRKERARKPAYETRWRHRPMLSRTC